MRAMSARGFNGYGPAVQAGQRDAGSSLRKAQMKNRIHEKEQLLNAAIANADISRSFEEYLEIFDAFYAEDITVSSDQQEEPTRGKANVRGLVFNFLVPLHVMAEVGGSKVTPFFCLEPPSLLHHARFQPFLDQADDSPV